MLSTLVLVAALASSSSSSVLAQSTPANCRSDVLIDDFSTIRNGFLPEEPTNPKIFNLMGGDYGAAGANFSVQESQRQMTIIAARENIGNPEPWANPGTAETINYWFTKFDQRACFDLRGFTAISFDLIAPAGSDMNFTMTQRTANCSWRGLDSVYRPLSSYITPDGTKKEVVLPFSDFARNLRGGEFDYIHLKDWTAVNLIPSGARFVMSNLVLRGNCSTRGNTTTTTNTTTSGTATATGTVATSSPTASPSNKIGNGASMSTVSALATALMGVIVMSFNL